MLKIYVPYMLSYYLRSDGSESHVARHVCKILMSPQQYEIFTSNATHRWESRGLPLCACARPWRVHIFTSQRRTNQSLQFSKKSIAMRWRWDIMYCWNFPEMGTEDGEITTILRIMAYYTRTYLPCPWTVSLFLFSKISLHMVIWLMD